MNAREMWEQQRAEAHASARAIYDGLPKPKPDPQISKYQQLVERDGEVCFFCLRPLTPKTATYDHYMPKIRGGSDEVYNLRLACSPCNQQKSGDAPELWPRGCLYGLQLAPVFVTRPRRKRNRPKMPNCDLLPPEPAKVWPWSIDVDPAYRRMLGL